MAIFEAKKLCAVAAACGIGAGSVVPVAEPSRYVCSKGETGGYTVIDSFTNAVAEDVTVSGLPSIGNVICSGSIADENGNQIEFTTSDFRREP